MPIEVVVPPETTSEAVFITPTLEDFRILCANAVAFRDLAPWWHIDEEQVFGVQNPETGEVGYCCIMGRQGEHFALAVYRKIDGLYTLLNQELDEDSEMEETLDLLEVQDCVMVSFECRDALEDEDRGILKALKLRFRGNGAWPLFRSFVPGGIPWFLTRDEAVFLNTALEQAIDVAKRCIRGPLQLTELDESETMLVRTSELQGDDRVWRDEMRPAPQPSEPVYTDIPANETALAPLADLPRSGAIWELSLFRLPRPAQKAKNLRPVFPCVVMAVLAHPKKKVSIRRRATGRTVRVTKSSSGPGGIVLGADIVSPEECGARLVELLCGVIEQANTLPAEFVVTSDELFHYVKPTAERLSIALTQSDFALASEEAKMSLLENMMLF